MTTSESNTPSGPRATSAQQRKITSGRARDGGELQRAEAAAMPRSATVIEQTDDLSRYVAALQTAARHSAEQSFVDWGKCAALIAQRHAEWAEQSDRAFVEWYTWWQTVFGFSPVSIPFLGCVSAWWWGCQNALPFAGAD